MTETAALILDQARDVVDQDGLVVLAAYWKGKWGEVA